MPRVSIAPDLPFVLYAQAAPCTGRMVVIRVMSGLVVRRIPSNRDRSGRG